MEKNQNVTSLKLSNGEYVVYGSNGICKFNGIVSRSFNNNTEVKYCELIPANSETSKCYVPIEQAEIKLRRLISKNDIYTLINEMPEIEAVWPSNTNERKNLFNSMLKSDNYKELICMIKSLHAHQKEMNRNGKKLSYADETTMRIAQNIMYNEFAMVLDIKPENVDEFIHERINNTANS